MAERAKSITFGSPAIFTLKIRSVSSHPREGFGIIGSYNVDWSIIIAQPLLVKYIIMPPKRFWKR
jgi:hypothetical protein